MTAHCQSQRADRAATRRCHLQRYNSKPATLEQYARVKPAPAGVPAEGNFGSAMAAQHPVQYGQVQQGTGQLPAYAQHSDPYVPLGAYIEQGVPEAHSPLAAQPPPYNYDTVSPKAVLLELVCQGVPSGSDHPCQLFHALHRRGWSGSVSDNMRCCQHRWCTDIRQLCSSCISALHLAIRAYRRCLRSARFLMRRSKYSAATQGRTCLQVAMQPAAPEPMVQPPPLRHSLVNRIRGVWEERQRQVLTAFRV